MKKSEDNLFWGILIVFFLLFIGWVIYKLFRKESYEMGERRPGYFYNVNKAYDFNVDYNKKPVQRSCGCNGSN